MDEKCACEVKSVLLFPCSGGSNVGQIANAACVELTKQGWGKMYCLAGIGAHVEGMVNSAAGADVRIAVDGCAVACARKSLEQAGLTVERAVVVTELGIKKNHEFTWTEAELAKVMDAAGAGIGTAPVDGGCGCKGE